MKIYILVATSIIASCAAQNTGEIDACVDSFDKKHRINDSYIGPDGCNTCRCIETGNVCTRMFCEKQTRMTSEANKCVDNKGNLHKVGESYTHVDGCNTCVCKDFGGACTQAFCFKPKGEDVLRVGSVCKDTTGKEHQLGDVWVHADGCNSCRCGAIGSICTRMFCGQLKDKKRGGSDGLIKTEHGTYVDESGDSPCNVNGQTKFPGDSWLTEDNCNICECTGMNGKVECTKESCRARVMKLVEPKKLGSGNNGSGVNTVSGLLIIPLIYLIL